MGVGSAPSLSPTQLVVNCAGDLAGTVQCSKNGGTISWHACAGIAITPESSPTCHFAIPPLWTAAACRRSTTLETPNNLGKTFYAPNVNRCLLSGLTPVAAFAAGLLAFASPCVLPIVPGLVGFVVGAREAPRNLRLRRVAAFVLGFTVAFAVIGLVIGAAGQTPQFIAAEPWLRRVGGALIITFGLVVLGLLKVGFLDRTVRLPAGHGTSLGATVGAALLGVSFGVGWSPCVGPILGSILVLAGLGGGAVRGAVLLSLFGLGLGVPFLLLGIAGDRGTELLRRHTKATRYVEVAGGVFLLALGVAVFTGAANRILTFGGLP